MQKIKLFIESDKGKDILIVIIVILVGIFSFVPKKWNLRETAAATTAATFATLPIMLFAFGRLSFVALPTNILLLPFIGATMFFGFFTALASLIFVPAGRISLSGISYAFDNFFSN